MFNYFLVWKTFEWLVNDKWIMGACMWTGDISVCMIIRLPSLLLKFERYLPPISQIRRNYQIHPNEWFWKPEWSAKFSIIKWKVSKWLNNFYVSERPLKSSTLYVGLTCYWALSSILYVVSNSDSGYNAPYLEALTVSLVYVNAKWIRMYKK